MNTNETSNNLGTHMLAQIQLCNSRAAEIDARISRVIADIQNSLRPRDADLARTIATVGNLCEALGQLHLLSTPEVVELLQGLTVPLQEFFQAKADELRGQGDVPMDDLTREVMSQGGATIQRMVDLDSSLKGLKVWLLNFWGAASRGVSVSELERLASAVKEDWKVLKAPEE